MFDNRELDLWIENDFNVLFRGKHGVGKTAVIIEAFNRHNLKWKYFSAATMDPWVDFVGVPKDTLDENGVPVLDLVRPRGFHNGEIEAIFMDELNRAPKKVRNAVMELIQFKSINGVKFPNLRFIWAAINPDDDEDQDTKYDVEKLDPAQKDRFQIIVDVPYKPVLSYFTKKYDTAGEGAVEWWNSLDQNGKEVVSPRRLEYAVQVWKAGGNVRHVLADKTLNVNKLLTLLDSGNTVKTLKSLLDQSDDERAKVFNNINFVNLAYSDIMKNKDFLKAFVKFLPKDRLSETIGRRGNDGKQLLETVPEVAEPILESIVVASAANKKVLKNLKSAYGTVTEKFIQKAQPKPNSVDAFFASTPPEAIPVVTAVYEAYREVNSAYGATVSVTKEKQTRKVLDTLQGNSSVGLDKQALCGILMFVVAVAARTQNNILNNTKHPLTSMLDVIKLQLMIRSNSINETMQDLWDVVLADSNLPITKRAIFPIKRSAVPHLSSRDIEKVKKFIGVS